MGRDYRVRADLGNRVVNAKFTDIVATQKWAIDYLCKGARVEILESGEVIEILTPEQPTPAEQYDEGDIADLLTLE